MAMARRPIDKVDQIPSEPAKDFAVTNRHFKSIADALSVAYKRIHDLEAYYSKLEAKIIELEKAVKGSQ